MIGIVICQQQRLAQNRLPASVGNLRIQIRLRILHELDHLFQIALKIPYALFPRSVIWRKRCLRPVPPGKIRGDMLRIPAELQNVPLRDSRVLQQLPTGVRQSLGEHTLLALRKPCERIFKMHVRSAAFQQINEVFSQRFVMILLSVLADSFFLRRFFQWPFSETSMMPSVRNKYMPLQATRKPASPRPRSQTLQRNTV